MILLTPMIATSGWLMIGVVDDAAQRAERGDRDGRAGQFVAGRRAGLRGFGEPGHLRRAVPEVARLGMLAPPAPSGLRASASRCRYARRAC